MEATIEHELRSFKSLESVEVFPNHSDLPISESEARGMLRLLQAQFNIEPRVIFSTRMKGLQGGSCYTRPILITLPKGDSGLLTEGRVLHDVAHVLDLEAHRVRPHSSSFKDFLSKVTEEWYGSR